MNNHQKTSADCICLSLHVMSIFSLLLLLLLSVDLLSAEFAAVRNSALSKLTASSFYVSLHTKYITLKNTHTHTHTHLTSLFPGLPGKAGTRKVKPIRILLKQEPVTLKKLRLKQRTAQHTQPRLYNGLRYVPEKLPIPLGGGVVGLA